MVEEEAVSVNVLPLFSNIGAEPTTSGCYRYSYTNDNGDQEEGVIKGLLLLAPDKQVKSTLFAEVVWPGSILAAEWLCDNIAMVQGARCLEVGCGQHALPSLMCYKLGAQMVVASDHPHSGVCEVLPSILIANNIPYPNPKDQDAIINDFSLFDGDARTTRIRSVIPCALDWEKPRTPLLTHVSSTKDMSTKNVNGIGNVSGSKYTEEPLKFDLAIAAECLWSDTVHLHAQLLDTLSIFLRKGGVCVVTWGDRVRATSTIVPNKSHGKQDNMAFIEMARTRQWTCVHVLTTKGTDLAQEGGDEIDLHVWKIFHP
jgi:predicted nicotinamide N-methyase